MSNSIFKIYALDYRVGISEADRGKVISYLESHSSSIVDGSITYSETEGVEFVGCGERLKKIKCNSCGKGIHIEKWQEIFNIDNRPNHGFEMSEYNFGCCSAVSKLAGLRYIENCGFSRGVISFEVFSHYHTGWLGNYPWLSIVEARY